MHVPAGLDTNNPVPFYLYQSSNKAEVMEEGDQEKA